MPTALWLELQVSTQLAVWVLVLCVAMTAYLCFSLAKDRLSALGSNTTLKAKFLSELKLHKDDLQTRKLQAIGAILVIKLTILLVWRAATQ
jgi:hypothetical protein